MRYRLVALAMFVALVACGSALGRAPDSGIVGRIVAGPTCPVERVPPVPGCAPRALVATLRIRRVGSRAKTTRVRSQSDGRFRVSLPPGTYTVQALPQAGSPLPRPPSPRSVQVRQGHFTAVTITYDTGIR
ncbi:MAG: hypothetical protein ACYDA6_02740 [Solirubrobacteraceae bacterium]